MTDTVENQKVEDILKKIEAILPRVGKKKINSPAILQELHQTFPGFKILSLIAGKGTDRRFEPPKDITPEEAPYRRSIMRLRHDQRMTFDDSWERYDLLSKRQLIRKSPACRVNITMFAAKEAESHQGSMAFPPADAESTPGVPDAEPMESMPSEGPVGPDGVNDHIDDHKDQSSQGSSKQEETSDTTPGKPSGDNPAESHQMPVAKMHHGPRFRALPKEEQAMIRRAHQNLCHPSPEQLSAVFRSQGCRPEISQAVFDMECPTCSSCQKPKISRPSSLKDSLDFNDKI